MSKVNNVKSVGTNCQIGRVYYSL